MRVFALVLKALILVATVPTDATEKQQHGKSKKQKDISELTKDLASAPEGIEKFYIKSEIVGLYASRSLSSVGLSDVRRLAQSLLDMADGYKNDWNHQNAIHHAHLVLGRVKLISGDIEGAKTELVRAAAVTGSPQLDTFGPNMTLAKELLEKGQRDAVLRYFEDCQKFWKSESARRQLEIWTESVKQGKIPNFRGNLSY
jgi:hypothetical protein